MILSKVIQHYLCLIISNRSNSNLLWKGMLHFQCFTFIKLNHMHFVQISVCFFMFHFVYFNGFLKAGGEEFCCPSSISRVVKGKILFILWIKCQILHRPFFGISTFNFEVVPKILTPPDDIIIMSFDPKGPKNKSYQIISTLISFER